MKELYISINVDSDERQDALVQAAMRTIFFGHGITEVWGGDADTICFANEEDILVPAEADDTEFRDFDEILAIARQCFAAQANDPDLFNSLIMAAEYQHSWPKYALPLMAAGSPAAEIINKVTEELRENEPMAAARPGYSHRTGTGRTSWNCCDGKIEIEISRPSGAVLAATIDTMTFDYTTEEFPVVMAEAGSFLPRHLEALRKAVSPFGSVPNSDYLDEKARRSQEHEIFFSLEKLKREIEELNPGCDFAALDAAVGKLAQ